MIANELFHLEPYAAFLDQKKNSLFRLTAAIEQQSEHPLARAIVEHAKEEQKFLEKSGVANPKPWRMNSASAANRWALHSCGGRRLYDQVPLIRRQNLKPLRFADCVKKKKAGMSDPDAIYDSGWRRFLFWPLTAGGR